MLLVACGNQFSTASGAAGTGAAAGNIETGGSSASAGSAQGGGDAGASLADAGDSATAGDAGATSGGTGGAAGNTSSAGAGGSKPTICKAGDYSQEGTNLCRSCSNFSRLQFAFPQKLTRLSQSAGSNERFPRPASSGSALFYVEGGTAANSRVWYAPTPISSFGSAVSEAKQVESGPVLAPGFVAENFFFDRLDAATGKRKIMMADWSGSGRSGTATLAPAPVNTVGNDDYSVAVAPGVARAYWMSTRNGTAQLFTYSNADMPPFPPVAVDIQIKVGAKSCPRVGDDATPWVNIDGTLLLFRSQSVNDNCVVNDSGAYDLFAVPLAKDGTAAGFAVALSSINTTGGTSNETDPSFSADACSLYFASDGGTGDFELYRATRN